MSSISGARYGSNVPFTYNMMQYQREDFAQVEPTRVEKLDPGFLRYHRGLQLLLCSECKLALLSSRSIKKHLRQQHPATEVSKEMLGSLESYGIISYADSGHSIPNDTYYFEDLLVTFNNYRCHKCSFLTTSYKSLKNHLVSQEGIKSTSTRRREDINNGIPLQVLYPSLSKGLFMPKLPVIGIPEPPKAIGQPRMGAGQGARLDSNPESDPNLGLSLFSDYTSKKGELANRSRNVGESSAATNPKVLSSFLKNSRFHLYLEGKNIKDLLALIEPIEKDDALLTSIHAISYDYSHKISRLIPNIIRSVRIDIRKVGNIATFLNTKDFIELESNTKKTYFKVFSDLVVFAVQLYLIQNNLRTSNNKDYIRQEVDFSPSLSLNIRGLLDCLEAYDDSSKSVEDDGLLSKIEAKINYIHMDLLKIPISFTTLKEYSLFRNPTIVFFILNSLNLTALVFKDERSISRLASMIIYNARLYTIGFLNLVEEGTSGISLEELYYNLSKNLLKSDSKNYLGEIINIRNYALRISKDQVSKNRPILELDADRLLVYNKEYSISKLSLAFRDLIIRLRDVLFVKLLDLDVNTLPWINLSVIRDNPLLNNLDFYLLDNPGLDSYKDYLTKLLLTPGSRLYKRYIKTVADQKPIYNIGKVNGFYAARKEFIDLVALAIYLTSSSPLRGEELVAITYKNTRDSIRNVIFSKEEELIMITTNYYKSYNIARKTKENIRFLNKDLSTLLVYYLVYVLPLYHYFNIEFLGNTCLSPLLLENKGKAISATSLSAMLYKFSSSYFREGLTINPYRHLINYIIKERLRYDIDLDEDLEGEEQNSIVDLLANRSTKVGNLSYSRELILGNNTRNVYNRSLQLCRDYFRFFGIDDYSLKDLDPSIILAKNLACFLQDTQGLKDQKKNNILELLQALKNPQARLLEEYLKEFFADKDAGFRDVYLPQALDLVIHNQFSFLTYVNKTGSGKSLLFLLPSFINPKAVYLVLTPRVSLKQNLHVRAKEKKISSYILEDLGLANAGAGVIPIGLVIGSIDSILGDTFNTFVRLIKKSNIHITIFLDEIHALILEANYRPILKYINSLLKFQIPLVFISATLPRSLLDLLNKDFYLEAKDNIIIKGPLNRENISYNIIDLDPKMDMGESIAEVISMFQRKGLGPNEKALIFVNSTSQGLQLSEELNLGFYYANNPEKDLVLKTFLKRDTESLVLLTTSALSVGVDFDIISFVLHMTPLYSLIDYIQESGRIRHQGHAYVLSNLKPTSSIWDSQMGLVENNVTSLEEFRALDKIYMTSFLKETRCLRMVINRFLDPTSIYQECNLEEELGCSLCHSNQEKLANKALIEEDGLKMINLGLVGLEEKLTELHEGPCLNCLLGFALDDSMKHMIDMCPNRDVILFQRFSINSLIWTIRDQIRSNQLLKAGSCCFTCLLPPRVCARQKEEQETIVCLYPNTLYLALGMLITNILKDYERSIRYFNLTDPRIGSLRSKSGLLKYLLEPSQIYTTDSIRLINVIGGIRLGSILELREREDEAREGVETTGTRAEAKDTESMAEAGMKARAKEEEKEGGVGRDKDKERKGSRKKNEKDEKNKKMKDLNNKRPRTPSRLIENLIISPNPRDKKIYKH